MATEVILDIRSEQTDVMLRWNGQDIWFSEHLKIQQMWVEDGNIVLQVDPTFKLLEQENGVAIVVHGEPVPEKPPRLLPLGTRLKER